ncbi:Concanavalin A-like lectin/glucanases superfamily protein [Cyclobacterium lianum]|uniref:Concanavalin A-like lectin/glucanases superfamily protein n=1 Tax=Cyclobacterium lianum TaxID=388280 RepID=A0A1M7KE01_9BACT|nr:DUF1553 domain-containing protein [Cyclobacterium lianum]SHM63467.1 Concanavalin A-like lectin/glucanases superfamily protein [Cyclobacterium lianum]
MKSLRFRKLLPLVIYSMGWVACGWETPERIQAEYKDLPEAIDFNYHVKPILSDKCFACHGPDAANQEADLRLDQEEFAFAALKSDAGSHAIVPGKPGKSELVRRILSDDRELLMPPPESNLNLSTEEIAILTKWIEQGAEYKPHWSFIPPEVVKLPSPETKGWARNEIDAFVAEKLQAADLQPASEASKEVLIRRLSFDLTGLPPSLEEIRQFVSDTSEGAYENLVDRLLASPAYGERMAADWMDVARYADSDGYLDDKHRDFSPYRDWVIEAFNQNMPYDQFITWQIAGDLIDNPSQESVLATAFNRLHKRNSEAGIVFEEYRAEYVADRTNTVGKAILGLSMECARCHDHKYDPISQKDYYEFSAYFNSTNELGTAVYGPGQVPGPSLLLTNDEQEQLLEYLDSQIRNTESKLNELAEKDRDAPQADPETLQADLKQLQTQGLVASYDFDQLTPQGNDGKTFKNSGWSGNSGPVLIREPDIAAGQRGKGIFINDFTTLSLPERVGWFDQTDPFSVSLSVFPDTVYKEAVLFTHCEDIRLGLKGYSLFLENNRLNFIMAYSWPTNALQVKTRDPIPVEEWSNISITYDGMGKAAGIGIYLNGEKVPVAVEADHIYKSILFEPDIHTYGFRGFVLGVRDKMKTFLNGGLDELKIYNRELSSLEVQFANNPEKAKKLIESATNAGDREMIREHLFKSGNVEAKKLRKSVQELRKQRASHTNDIPEIMVMGDLPEPRPTFILDRGLYSAPTEQVYPNVPEAVLPGESSRFPQNRLGLAQWLVDQKNPLTARVFVNRLWQMHFGNGLVKTSDDFGSQGSLPSHPELLDWLSVTFRESGWDIKKMHKLIVMSATYRQSSKTSPELQEKDPENELLARGPSFRMTAEMVRDNALAISGLLVPRIGGESAYPYQPEGLWDEISTKSWRYRYLQEPGDGLYRRSLYTIWKRTSGPPSMMIFDVGDRAECTVKRTQTSTPLQALVLLNDPQFVEAARVTAEKLIEKYEPEQRLENAFQLSTGRQPNPNEKEILQQFFTEETERFSQDKNEALAYLSTGSNPRKTDLDPVQVAALATVINGIMNTSDGYTIR